MQRALAFEYILEHKHICINDGELIVGERGEAPKATPTYPEICLHSLEDLETLDSRPKVSFKVSAETKKVYADKIIPHWKGKTQRDRIFNSLDNEWKNAYKAGIFTEFQEQRAPGHTVGGNKIYQKGMLDLIKEINHAIDSLDFFTDRHAYEKREELRAMAVTAEALIKYSERHTEALEKIAVVEKDQDRKDELLQMADITRRVPAHAPQTFHEALQQYWFIHLGVITELNPWDSFNPGRLDQHLYPFFKKETEDGTLTRESSRDFTFFLDQV